MVSKRVLDIKASGIREIFDMATKNAINLGLGELDMDPPVEAKEAIKEAVEKGYNRYGPTKGLPELREAIARKQSRYRSDIGSGNILITASGTQATMATIETLFDPGDEVLIQSPVLSSMNLIVVFAMQSPYHISSMRTGSSDLTSKLSTCRSRQGQRA